MMAKLDLHDLEQEEMNSAECLRSAFGPWGNERKPKLNESSEILFSMGRLYVKKAAITEGMEQKLNFIRAAALLHGCKVRFGNIMGNITREKEVSKVLGEMEQVFWAASGCDKSACGLLSLSEKLRIEFGRLRDVEHDILEKLEVIDENLPEDETHKKRVVKISIIKKLLQKNTANYGNLMCGVARDCLRILGSPPCNYAMAGLGSLAREEITLYSDFEHVIILEDGVQDLPNYHEIKEYFRWFAVLFQIIIIGVGETFIRSVGVKSINDLNTSDKSKNWFYDTFTPSGVSFDGMVPYSCKTPLGRQEPTEKKKHIVELIQPVSLMVKYMTVEEDLKNGYCLKDVLYQASFVFGSKEIFEQFEKAADETVKSDPVYKSLKSLSKEAKTNVNKGVQGVQVLQSSFRTLESKVAFYRPLATLLCYWARLNGSKSRSGFDKIHQCFNKEHHFLLEWAFAVACEVRMKLYAAERGNRTKVLGKEILKTIAKPCLVNCASAVTNLSHLLNKPWFQSSHKIQLRQWPDSEPAALLFLGEHDNAKKILLSNTYSNEHRSLNGLVDPINSTLALAFCHFRDALLSKNDEIKREFLQKAEDTLKQKPMCLMVAHGRHTLASIYFVQGRYQESLSMMESIFSELNLTHRSVSSDDIINYRETQIDTATLSMNNTAEVIEYFKLNLAGNLDLPSKLIFRYGFARENHRLENKGIAQEALSRLTHEAVTEGPRVISEVAIIKLLHQVFVMQYELKLVGDCYKTLATAEDLLESGPELVDIAVMAPQFVSIYAVHVFLSVAENNEEFTASEKISVFEKAIKICRRPENEKLCQS